MDSRLDALGAQLAATEQRILATVEGRFSSSWRSTPLVPADLAATGGGGGGDSGGHHSAARAAERQDDRKRLKERLKGAIEQDREAVAGGARGAETAGWAEYLFGICKPDGRTGKIGSRYQSSRVEFPFPPRLCGHELKNLRLCMHVPVPRGPYAHLPCSQMSTT